MNFDELQSAWNSDKGNDIVVPDSITKLRSVATPVERIRRNMRTEFVWMLLLIIGMGFFPLLRGVKPVPFYAMYAAMILLTLFYYIKFYFFYKRLNDITLNSKDNLYAVYYDIKLNVEMYRSFNYSVIPLLLLYQVMVIMTTEEFLTAASTYKRVVFIVVFSIIFLIAIGIITLLVECWVRHFYGKYLEQVHKVLEELKEE